jgi:hypothetical protein
MRADVTLVPMLCLLAANGCGGSDAEPLVSSALSGEYKGESFTPTAGTAHIATNDLGGSFPSIGFGTGDLNCSSWGEPDPPGGFIVSVTITTVEAFEPGTYQDVGVTIADGRGEYEFHGSGGGILTLTAVTPDTVSGMIQYSDTDVYGDDYSINGTFEVSRCP